MAVIFVTRHSGTRDWARRRGTEARFVEHIEVDRLAAGDIVLGTLPVHLAAEVCRRGARYRHLVLDLPAEARGRDLAAEDIERFRARIVEYRVEQVSDRSDEHLLPF